MGSRGTGRRLRWTPARGRLASQRAGHVDLRRQRSKRGRAEWPPDCRGDDRARLALGIGRVFMYSKILIPLDGSEPAEAVIPYVREIADKFGSQITLLQVVSTTPPVMPAEPGMVTPVEAEILLEALQEEVAAAELYLTRVAAQLQGPGRKVS